MVPYMLRLRGELRRFEHPIVAGILNATPDSFYSGSRTHGSLDELKKRCEVMMQEGADMIDVGAYSSRPGADEVLEAEELDRLGQAFEALKLTGASSLPISVDTFRARVAREAVESMGADIVNDISGGSLDGEMFPTVAALHCPYILMHMRGTPATMQSLCDYGEAGVSVAVVGDLSGKIQRLAELGVNDIIIDPGFGFAKTVDQNYQLLHDLPMISRLLQRPILVGVSRKSMITRFLGIQAEQALNATTAVNVLALERGAAILRVHDVGAAREAVAVTEKLHSFDSCF